MKQKKVAIVGGGASGLMAAITAAKLGASVDLFEQNDKVAKKIKASGNGRCNISNINLRTTDYFGENPSFVDFALKQFSFSHFKKFCKSIGLFLDIKDDGRVYPLSNEAKSAVALLSTYAKKCKVSILTEHSVKNIEKEGDEFCLRTSKTVLKGYAKVLICTGSEAAPRLGGNDDGYRFSKSFGHTIQKPYPSLVQLQLESKYHHKMAGVKQYAEVSLYINAKQKEKVEGDILFTHYGISGFAILDISQAASHALIQNQKVQIGLNLLKKYERQELSTQIAQLCKTLPDHQISTLLLGLIPSKIIPCILDSCSITDTVAKNISAKTIKRITNTLLDWRFVVKDTHGFKHAEASGGGISTKEINNKTMESKLIKGLYFAGEVIDIVGKRGGYNLHFAWASGYIAGRELAK